MATAIQPVPLGDRDEAQRRVHHPLQRLRGYIRLYVLGEGLAVLGLYVALWFWIGLALDYGFFKLFAIDWVQELPRSFRAVVLGILVAGLLAVVTLKVVLRLAREFRDSALALILERRYPAELGDRLITAVELADPALAKRYGFSKAMIDQTIQEAAERVERLPIDEVFAWRRLRRAGLAVAVLIVGVYLLVGLGYSLRYEAGVSDFVTRFNNVAVMWFERNVLLANTIWPRRVHLELVNFPLSGELRIGRNAPPPTLRVRALRWVVSDPDAPEGWRALAFADLTPDLLGGDYLPPAIPAGWRRWSVDDIELQLDKPEARALLDADTVIALRGLMERLELRAQSPRMARRLRQLEVPESVEALYQGESMQSEQRLQKQTDNEYAGVVADLRESVRFTVRGEDYFTPPKRITLVPPPGIVELSRDEYRPAYLYHHLPAGSDPAELKGKRQEFKDLPVSLGGPASRIDVPAGSDVVLKARTDKPLRVPGGVRLKDAPNSHVPIVQPDEYSFQVDFKSVGTPLEFAFEFTDTDNVLSLRQVVLKPMEDLAPEVDVQVEVIRKTNQGYLVTPIARVPFSGKVRDDHGLSNIEYVHAYARVEAQTSVSPAPLISAFQVTPGGPSQAAFVAVYLAWVAKTARTGGDELGTQGRSQLASFARSLRDHTADETPLSVLPERLRQKPVAQLLRDHNLDPADEFFDVEKLGLRVSGDNQVQPHFRLRLVVTATDNNIETGPGVGQSKERFNFLVISENELLTEIAKEEESLHVKLEDTVNRLKEARGKLDHVSQELPRLKPEEFSPIARRAEEIAEVVVRCWDFTREVHTDYRRILKELQANRVQPGIINRVERNICEPLEAALNQEFVRTDDAARLFHKALEERKADLKAAEQLRANLEQLIDRLSRVLDAMGDVTTINKLIALLVEVEKGERQEFERLKKLRDDLQEKILDDVLTPVKPKEGKP